MAIPHITVKATNMELTELIEELIEERLRMLDRLVDESSGNIICDAEVEMTSYADDGRRYRGEANLTINGTLYRAEAYGVTAEDAFDSVRNELKTALTRSKAKQESLIRRGGRKIKEMLRFGG